MDWHLGALGARAKLVSSRSHVVGVRRARFTYVLPRGRDYDVTGWGVPADSFNDKGVGYRVDVRPAQPRDYAVGATYALAERLWIDLLSEPVVAGDNGTLWWEALRRFALTDSLARLDLSQLDAGDMLLDSASREALNEFRFRDCEHQLGGRGADLVCGLSTSGNPQTTRKFCADCLVPDPWEICANLCSIETHGIEANSASVIDRRCTGALCHTGVIMRGRLPSARWCRFTETPPSCYTVPHILRPAQGADDISVSTEDLVSAVNVEWKKRNQWELFRLVSYQPLQHLRGDCRDAGDFRNRVAAIAEILEQMNEAEMRSALDPAFSRGIERGQTVSVLEAFLKSRGSPRAGEIVQCLRLVQRLRNLAPTHPPDRGGSRALDALRELGYTWPIPHGQWPAVWAAVVQRFRSALEAMLDDLREDTQ